MKLGIIGDFACPTGLGAVNHALAQELSAAGWDISVLAVNYHGDPHPLQAAYRLWPADSWGHPLGYNRLCAFVQAERPDVLLIHFDPWIVRSYLDALESLPEADRPPVVAYVPVDGVGYHPRDGYSLNRCARVVAYTQFGARELRLAGCTAPMQDIPLGTDLEVWAPLDRREARRAVGIADDDAFIVLVADRNQSRKRLDLAWEAFAIFARDVPEAKLLYHGAPCEPTGYDCMQLSRRFGLAGRVGFTMPGATDPAPGLPDAERRLFTCAADVRLSAAQGEGWGLNTAEALACGIPSIAVDWAAIPEWAAGAVRLVPTIGTYTYTNPPSGHQGGVADVEGLTAALWDLHTHPVARAALGERGRIRMQDPAFRWEAIGARFDALLREVASCGT